ncbi:MAG TPA: S8 family serine peptidase [Mycobacteriales bacterium]|nr:S8 family serine peptidase [Mycobacteriales bacterium]
MRRRTLSFALSTALMAAALAAVPAGPAAVAAEGGGHADPGYDRTVRLLGRAVNTAGIDPAVLAAARGAGQGRHAVVQLHRLPRAGELDQLAGLGVRPLAYLNGTDGIGTAYLARISPDVASGDALRPLVRALQPLVASDKIDPDLGRRGAVRDVLVSFFSDVPDSTASAALGAVGADGRPIGLGVWRASLTTGQVHRLAAQDAVQFLALAPLPGQLDLGVSRTLSNVDVLQQLDVGSGTYLGLSGAGVQVSIHDSGVDEHHGDFAGRMIRTLHPAAGGDHGTHVASIAAGSGAMSDQNDDMSNANGGTAFQWRGMAPQAGISAFGSQTGHDLPTMTTAVVTDGVDVSNHSYSYNDGQYDATMASIDSIIRGDAGIPARPQVFSAGNQGQAPQFGNNSGYFSLSKSCKNCIMVANLQDGGALNGGSSHGPTPDGRLKPDVGANGTTVTAAGADVGDGDGGPSVGNSYRSKGGTSMAAPAVSGIVALMLQRYAQRYGVDLDSAPPLPSTMKALLVQSAQDQAGTASGDNPDTAGTGGTVYGPGPDWGTGYGLVDAGAAVRLIDTDRFVEDEVSQVNHTDEHLVSVVPGQTELRITLAWDDLPGTPNSDHAARQLVNDLDLLLVGPQGQTVRPLVVPAATQFDCDGGTAGTQTGCASPGADPGPWPSSTSAIDAAPGTDRLNNVEQVVVAAPAPGLWKARVSVLNTDTTIRLPLGGTQAYSLAGVTADRADLVVTKGDSPDPAIAGEQLFYPITVRNAGPDPALDVTVVDTLPTGVSFVTTDVPGLCTQAPVGTLTCSLGDLAAGASRSFTVKVAVDPSLVADNGGPLGISNTATAASTTPDDDRSDNTAVASTIVEDRADLRVTKLCKPDRRLLAGQTGTCTVYVDNLGPSDARQVVLRDTHKSDGAFTFGSITPSQGSCTESGGVITCQLGTLPVASATDSGRATLTVEVSADEEVDINDVADARATTPDPDRSNNVAEGTISVQAVSDLSLTKTGPGSAVAGTEHTYALAATNGGPSTARGVVIEDVVPVGVQVLAVSGSDGATCNAGSSGSASLPTRCSFGDLPPGAIRTMTVRVLVLPDTLGVVHNDARVTSSTFDDDLSDNLATVPTTVTGEADLSLTKTDAPDAVLAGNQLTWTLEVTNSGPSTARAVRITDPLPAGTTFVSGVDGNGAATCALVQPDRVVCELGDMAVGAVRTVYLTAKVAASLDPTAVITNTATVSSATTDPSPANNSATATTDVDTSSELWLDKQAGQQSGNPSPVVVFTLVVHNDSGCETDSQSSPTPTCGEGGPSDARDVLVADTLPLDPKKLVVQYVSPQCTYDKVTHTVTCTSAVVPAGATVTFVIEAQVSGSVGTITNSATVSSSTPDPVTSNNTNAASLVMKGGTGSKKR